MTELQPTESKSIILINPNLGHPRFINIKPKDFSNEILTDLLLVTNISDSEELIKRIENKISLIPILDYKWNLKQVLEEERKKKKPLKLKIKLFFKRKRKKEETRKILKKIRPKGFRGNILTSSIANIEKRKTYAISDVDYLEDDYCTPHQFLTDNQIFNEMNHYFKITIKFFLSKEVLDYLKERKFIMFDLIGPKNRINYHSLIITKQNWKNFTFIQITDTHLAERNDRIYEIVKKWLKSSIKQSSDIILKKIKKRIKSTLKKSSDEDKKLINRPLRKRLINPNNQLRKFIKLANQKVLQNELDFIVLTGDIVDYVIKTKYNQKVMKINDLDFEYSNWKFFKDIILNNKSKEKHKGVIMGEELLCPIFTIVGNHDFRPNHYDLTWAGLYKKLGLNSSEALALNELLSTSPISAIIKSKLALKNYISEINCSLDFSFTLGNIPLVFLNSGSDSFKNIRDFFSGHPSVTGLKSYQIKFLENLINNKLKEKNKIILLLHGPPVNIGKKPYFKERFKKWRKKSFKKKKEGFKDSISMKLEKKEPSTRIDGLYNIKLGTISSNWERLINFCKDYTILTLSGHTHLKKEFKLGETNKKTKVYDAPPFILKKIENPAAIYYDVYSENHNNAKDIEENGPYIVQTPALGLGSFKNPKINGAYRVINIKNNKLDSFEVHYLDK